MAIKKQTFGMDFPFVNSNSGDYVGLTTIPESEVKAMLIHLLLTKKGSRYFLPDFGTNLYQYIFEPLDDITLGKIEAEIQDAVEKYIPNLLINRLTVEPLDPEEEADDNAFTSNTPTSPVYRYPGKGTAEYTAKIKIEYSVQDSAFATSDFVIINI